MFYTQSEKYDEIITGQHARPSHYPVLEKKDGLLFYIQRNQNINAVIYTLNTLHGGVINLAEPIKIQWIKYDEQKRESYHELNAIQRSLAYGYHHQVINHDCIEMYFLPYPQLKFYIIKNDSASYEVRTTIDGQLLTLDMIYIYAEDLGIFPQVKFAEIYGTHTRDSQPFYHKIIIDQH
jgi:hypothetical protein